MNLSVTVLTLNIFLATNDSIDIIRMHLSRVLVIRVIENRKRVSQLIVTNDLIIDEV